MVAYFEIYKTFFYIVATKNDIRDQTKQAKWERLWRGINLSSQKLTKSQNDLIPNHSVNWRISMIR